MTNQIYPAVLGTLVYMLFDWGYFAYSNFAQIQPAEFYFKTAVLLLLVIFYLSDFYYIKWSKPYRKFHFFFDIIFMICMIISAKVLKVDTTGGQVLRLNIEDLNILRYCFLVFLGLYAVWDFIEISAKSTKSDTKPYYFEVIVWECISIGLILFSLLYRNGDRNFLLISLVISTAWFCLISYRKKNHLPYSLFRKIYKRF